MLEKSKNLLVSVIITTYERPNKLGRAIDSALNQTYKNIEVIVIDDNGLNSQYQKKTEKYMANYLKNNKVTYIRHDKNQGACTARNTGIDNSKGDYIAFLDDDDEWVKSKIEKQVNLMLSNNKIGLVFCDFKYLSNNKSTNFKFYDDMFVELLKRCGGISTSTFLVRKSVLVDVNNFDTNLPSNQDYDLLLKISMIYKVDYVPEVLMLYDDISYGITQNYKNKLEGSEQIIFKYEGYYYENNITKYLAKQYDKVSHFSIMSNDKKKSIKYLNKSLKIKINIINLIRKWIILIGGKDLYLLYKNLYSKVKLLFLRQ